MGQIRHRIFTGPAWSRLVRNLTVKALFALGLLIAAAVAAAQTYTDLYDFDGTHGASPAYPQLLAQGQDGNLYGTAPSGGSNSGVVFRVTPAGALTVIHTFNNDGFRPNAGLALGTDGNFYGTTVLGGTNNVGEIFKVTPSGTLTVLYSFTNGSDGAYPYGTPTLANDGNFYGLTQSATAYKITPSGTFKLLGTIPDRSFAPLCLGKDGNLYGTTQHGGSLNQGTVFKMTTAGKVTVIYNFDVTHGGVPWGGLVQGADGNFYGTASGGGSGGGGVVFRVTPAGTIKVLHNFPVNDPSDGEDPVAGLVAATDGSFYGATSTGGSNGFGVLFKVTSAGHYTLLYNFDKTHGAGPESSPVQHTNGTVYGEASAGGSKGDGVFFSLDLSLGQFVKLVLSSGKVGNTVEILGAGFNSASKVKFNGKSATFTIVSDTYLTAKVPAGSSTGPVTVTTSAGTLTSSTTFRVTPKITSFDPTSGPVGTSVVITGHTFTGATKVTFGGVKASTFSVDSDTQVTAIVPTGAKTGKIAITTPSGTGSSSGVFTVTP
jgi:uncharacterized repeat protein (TIGR03803 family)